MLKIKKKKIKGHSIRISSVDEIIDMINRFEMRRGRQPRFIITSDKKRKVILEKWLKLAPEEIKRALGYNFDFIPIVTTEEVMIL